jgi:hypothetical protein
MDVGFVSEAWRSRLMKIHDRRHGFDRVKGL